MLLAAKVLELLTKQSLATNVAVVTAATLVYTYIGGLKAVVWTDVLQFTVYILTAFVALFLLHRGATGGWPAIWNDATAHGKLKLFDFSLDLSRPYTFWAGLIGGLVLDMGTHGADHMMVQRYLAAHFSKTSRVGLDPQRPVDPRAIRHVPVFGMHALVPLSSREPSQRSRIRDIYRRRTPFGDSRPGDRGGVFGDDEHALRVDLGIGLRRGQRLLSSLEPPRGRSSDFTHLQSFDDVLGDRPLGNRPRRQKLQDHVVNNALAIASFAGGILLGLFLLALVSRAIPERAALLGCLAGLLAVTYAKFGRLSPYTFYPLSHELAWPWFSLVGASTVVCVGVLASLPKFGARVP